MTQQITVLWSKRLCSRKGCDVVLQRIRDTIPPDYAKYRVNYAGNGKYLQTFDDVIAYIRKRKFLNNAQIERLKNDVAGKV